MAVETRWWVKSLDDSIRAQRVTNTAQRLWRDQDPLRTNMVRCARLYGNLPIMGLSPRLYRHRGALAGTWNRLALNVVKSVTDSYVAMLTKDKPKVTFVTSGADYDLQDKAEQAEKFVDGIFYDADVYELAQQLALDSAVFPFGVVKLYDKEDDEGGHHVGIQRIFPWEVLADEEEAAYGFPKTLYHVKWIDKLALKEEFPKKAESIEYTRGGGFEDNPSDAKDSETVELIAVVEAWHLPSKKSPGMHVIAVGDTLLLEEKWDRDTFPFEFLYRQRPIMGIWGISLAEELAGIQREINILLQKIQRAHHMMGAAHWLVEDGSTQTNQLDNNIGSVIKWRGSMPKAVTPGAVNPEVYEHLDRLYQRAFEIIGISQQAAQSQKPAGLNSGKALQAYADIQTQRFQPSYREFQNFFLRIARQVIALADQIAEKDPHFGVKSPGKNTMSVIKWMDVHMREEEFVLKLYPTNALADEPAARMQQVEDMARAGWIDPMTARRLLDFPDLESMNDHEMASYKATTGIITKILKEGKFLPPEPFMNLQESITLVRNSYLDARNKNARPERLNMLLTWLEQADEMLNPPPDPNAPPPQPLGAPPMPGALPGPPMPQQPPMAA